MDLKELFLKKSQFAARLVGDELILVPLNSNVSDMDELFTLNELGCFIWEQINETNTESDILQSVISEFDIDENIAKKDLTDFLLRLHQLFQK
jgi:hypothetical protein